MTADVDVPPLARGAGPPGLDLGIRFGSPTGIGGQSWASDADNLGVEHIDTSDGFGDSYDGWAAPREVTDSGAILVRPAGASPGGRTGTRRRPPASSPRCSAACRTAIQRWRTEPGYNFEISADYR